MARRINRKRALTSLLLLASPLLCPLIMRVHPGEPPDFSDTRSLYQWRNGAWNAAPRVTGGVEGVQVSTAGALWAISPSGKGLARFAGGQWSRFVASDFGTLRDNVPGGFAVLGDEVWAATRGGVARFNGTKWRLYREALKSRNPMSIAAGSSGVWVVDAFGFLSHFDGEQWNIEDLNSQQPGANWMSRVEDDRPRLAVTADGALWLTLGGVWRLDEHGWRTVRQDSPASVTALIGTERDRVWVRDGAEIFSVKPDGSTGVRFEQRNLPISPRTEIASIAFSDQRPWVATTKDLLTLDGSKWQRLGMPPGVTLVREVSVAPDGSAWVVGETRSVAKVAGWVAPPLIACAVALAFVAGLLVTWAKAGAEDRLSADQAVAKAAGNVPGLDLANNRAEVKRQARNWWWKVLLIMVGFPYVIAGIGFGERLLQQRLPGAPEWLLYTFELAPAVLMGAFWMWRKHRKQPGAPSSPYRKSFGSEIRLTLCVAVIVFFLRCVTPGWLLWTLRIIPNSSFGFLLLTAVVVISLMMLLQGRDIAAVMLTRRVLRTGEYDRTLKQIRWLELGRPTPVMLVSQGNVLSLAGRSGEAEGYYRAALARAGGETPAFRAQTLTLLGFALTDLRRYDEARRCLESAVRIGDRKGSARVGLAELLLDQGIEPDRALALLDEAMSKTVQRQTNAERAATKAWALALLGRQSEAETAMRLALNGADPAIRPVVASIHWRIGKALVATQRLADAKDHFWTGYRTDPNGVHGGLSRTELQQLGALSA